jgi:hypothetical protein
MYEWSTHFDTRRVLEDDLHFSAVTPNHWTSLDGRVDAHIYVCGRGYCCVGFCSSNESFEDTGWRAPIVWKGPRAHWDSETHKDTLEHLKRFFAEEFE